MRRSRLNHAIAIIVLSMFLCSLFIFVNPFLFPKVLAQYTWTDTFNVYQNITVLEPSIRVIKNTYGFPIDVKVYIVDVNNIAKISLYETFGNNTEFIYIKDGVTLRTENTYNRLEPNQILAFNLLAKPTDTLGIGETITVQKKVEIYKSLVAPPPIVIPPPIVMKFPLDLKITALPAIVCQPFQPSFKSTVTIINKATVGTDVLVRWWIVDAEGKTYDGGQKTIFISGLDKKEIEISVPTPSTEGKYTLHVQSVKPTVVIAENTFQVVVIPIWMLFAVGVTVILTLYIIKKRRK